MKSVFSVALVAVFLSACAAEPEKISAIPVSGDPYGSYSCRQLQAERLKIVQELEAASAQQRKTASNDAMGVFLLGLPLGSMGGNDKEAVIAVAKGRVDELDRKILERGCR